MDDINPYLIDYGTLTDSYPRTGSYNIQTKEEKLSVPFLDIMQLIKSIERQLINDINIDINIIKYINNITKECGLVTVKKRPSIIDTKHYKSVTEIYNAIINHINQQQEGGMYNLYKKIKTNYIKLY